MSCARTIGEGVDEESCFNLKSSSRGNIQGVQWLAK